MIEVARESEPEWVVAKFGGTSVSTRTSWERIARIVRGHLDRGQRPLVVCSAIAGTTDALERLDDAAGSGSAVDAILEEIEARHVELGAELGIEGRALVEGELETLRSLSLGSAQGPHESAARRAAVLACGERMSTQLGSHWLTGQGLTTRLVDARELLLATDRTAPEEHFLSAACGYETDTGLARGLAALGGAVTMTQGFAARDDSGRTVVLGRGGSDTSAAYLGAIVGAHRVEIWTDVPGLFTANPHRIPDAELLEAISQLEAQTVASLGGEVLHPRCLEPARAAGIPIRIGWTEHPERPGTTITPGDTADAAGAKVVSSRADLALVTLDRGAQPQPVGFMAAMATRFQRHGLSMDLIASSPSRISATVDLAANPAARRLLPELLADLQEVGDAAVRESVCCVSVVGTGLTRHFEELHGVHRAFDGVCVHLVSHAANDCHVSWVVDEQHRDQVESALHRIVFPVSQRTDAPEAGTALHALRKRAAGGGSRRKRP